MNKHSVMVIVVGLAMAGCPKSTTSTTTTTTTTGAAPVAGNLMAGTLAEAPKQAFPSTIDIKPECHQDNYLILEVPEGTKFTIDAKPSAGCVHVAVMNENGSVNGLPQVEVCADAPKVIDAVGQANKTFIAMNEAGACTGISVNVAFK